MLDVAIKYEELLNRKFIDTWFDDKYKWWNSDTYYQIPELSKDSWDRHEFVSINKEGEIIGFISYGVDRQANRATKLQIINFTNDKMTFGLDVYRALKDIFEKFNFNKLIFNVIVGNPIEKSYDKIIKKYGGKICAYYKNDVKLTDGQYYDFKGYEILSEDYFKAIKKENDNNE